MDDETTHFGFQSVPVDQKSDLIQELFAGVSARYDLMNDIMSVRMHRIWKTALIDWMAPQPGQRILDLAGGTGDIAFRLLKRQPAAEVTVLDLTEEMLERGRRRAARTRVKSEISWIAGDAGALPFADGSFDVCSVAFGVRNFSDIPRALGEMFRILRTGGRLLILEFGQVEITGLRKLYDKFSFEVIPDMGRIIANDRASYQYLVESIRRFPDRHRFAGMIETAGFANVKFRDMAFGIATIHNGWKI